MADDEENEDIGNGPSGEGGKSGQDSGAANGPAMVFFSHNLFLSF